MWSVYLVTALMMLLPTREGYIRKLRHFDDKITCFGTDNATGTLYVQVQPYHVIILDRDLSPVAAKDLIWKRMPSKDYNNKTNGDLTVTGHEPCVLSSTAVGSGRTQVVVPEAPTPSTECGPHGTSSEKVIYSSTSGLYKYDIVIAEDNYGISATRLQRLRNDADCSHLLDFSVQCKQPNFKVVSFLEATSAFLAEKGNGSSSLFVSFAAFFQSRTYHVVCEYELHESKSDSYDNKTIPQAASSAIWQSNLNVTALRKTNLENNDVLIINQRNQVRMLWLPLGKYKDIPQPLLDNEFRRGRASNSDVYVTPDVLGVLPNDDLGEIYVANDSSIYLLKLDKCSQKLNCRECLSGISYCGWCPARRRCTFEQLCASDNANNTTQMWMKSNLGGHEIFCKSDIERDQLKTSGDHSEHISLLATFNTNQPNRPHVFPQELQDAEPDTYEKIQYVEKDISVDITIMTAAILVLLLSFLVGRTFMKLLDLRRKNTAVFLRIKSRHAAFRSIKSYRKLSLHEILRVIQAEDSEDEKRIFQI